MIVVNGYADNLIITQGYGRLFHTSFIKVRDFEKSFYKFVKEGYADLNEYSVYYGSIRVDPNEDSIWLYCNFSELNVETGHFSTAYINVVTRIGSVDEYNTQLLEVVDDLRTLFANSDIDLYDFTILEAPQIFLDSKIVIMDSGKQVYESVSELEFAENKSLIQSAQFIVKMKLLENYARSRVVT